jgi:hypothetical protein
MSSRDPGPTTAVPSSRMRSRWIAAVTVRSGVLLWLGGCLTESFWIRSLSAGLGAGAGGFIVA